MTIEFEFFEKFNLFVDDRWNIFLFLNTISCFAIEKGKKLNNKSLVLSRQRTNATVAAVVECCK